MNIHELVTSISVQLQTFTVRLYHWLLELAVNVWHHHHQQTQQLSVSTSWYKLCGKPPQCAPTPCKLTFDLLTLKVVSESRVTWSTSVTILVFLGLSVLDLGPMYATDRRQTRIIN